MIASATRTVFVLLIGLIVCTGCSRTSTGPEDEIRAWVDAMHAAAEDKDRREVMAGISEAYTDSRGNNRDDINDMLRAYFLRQSTISLLVNIDSIEVYADTAAKVSLTVGMAGMDNSAFGFSADAYRFELELERPGDDWQLIAARWGEIGQQLR